MNEKEIREMTKLQIALVRFIATRDDEFASSATTVTVVYGDAGGNAVGTGRIPLTIGGGSVDVFKVSR